LSVLVDQRMLRAKAAPISLRSSRQSVDKYFRT